VTDSQVGSAEVPVAQGAPSESTTVQPPVTAADSTQRDAEVLVLREQGRSFSSIARALGFEGARPANAAFNRALRRLPPSEQESLRGHEMSRLDAMGERINQRQDLDDEEKARRARSLDQLRKKLSA
jgi:hypothetical protein